MAKTTNATAVAATDDKPTHYLITVRGLVKVAGAELLPGQRHRVKAAVFDQIDKSLIEKSVALHIQPEA